MIIIPARLESQRFPRKLLVDIAGEPLIVRTAQAAIRCGLPVVVATDSDEIAGACKGVVNVVRTQGAFLNGTERVAWAAEALELDPHYPIINWQGDSPFLDIRLVWGLMAAISGGAEVASAYYLGTADPVQVHLTKSIPPIALDFFRDRATGAHHLGVYAYSRDALRWYADASVASAEYKRGLEQMRWFTLGVEIAMVKVDDSKMGLEINTPDDVPGVLAQFQ